MAYYEENDLGIIFIFFFAECGSEAVGDLEIKSQRTHCYLKEKEFTSMKLFGIQAGSWSPLCILLNLDLVR